MHYCRYISDENITEIRGLFLAFLSWKGTGSVQGMGLLWKIQEVVPSPISASTMGLPHPLFSCHLPSLHSTKSTPKSVVKSETYLGQCDASPDAQLEILALKGQL